MSDLYSNDKIREAAERIVRTDVHYCVSSLVSSIAQAGDDAIRALKLDYDDLMPILESFDYDEPAVQRIADMDRSELADYLESQSVEFDRGDESADEWEDDETEIAALRVLAREALAEQGAQDFCDDERIEPDRSEVYEHWIISDWLAGKLEDKGHPITRDFLGLTIWGRPTTGQSIAMDGVILEIARDIQ